MRSGLLMAVQNRQFHPDLAFFSACVWRIRLNAIVAVSSLKKRYGKGVSFVFMAHQAYVQSSNAIDAILDWQ